MWRWLRVPIFFPRIRENIAFFSSTELGAQLKKVWEYGCLLFHNFYNNASFIKSARSIKHKYTFFILEIKGLSVCFDCLLGNVRTPFKNYFTRLSHSVNAKNRFSSIKLPNMNLEFGRRRFSFSESSIFNSLRSDK